MAIKTYYQTFLNDKNGKNLYDIHGNFLGVLELGTLIHKSRKRISHSFVRQFLQMFYPQTSKIAQVITDIVNSGISITQNSNNFSMDGAIGEDDVGIVIGTGSTAVTVDDYKLDTKVAHGVGAGQLQYGGQAFQIPVVGATDVDYVLTRTYLNGSAGAVIVTEIGIDGEGGGALDEFLFVRDVLGSSESVGVGLTLTVQYTFNTTVS